MKKYLGWFFSLVLIIFFVSGCNYTIADLGPSRAYTENLTINYNVLVAQYEQLRASYNSLVAQNNWYRNILIETYGWQQ